jgi:hypothetical protein
VLKQISPLRAIEAVLIPSLRERLARRTGTQQIVCWNRFNRNFANVPLWDQPEILEVQIPKALVDFAGEHALVTELSEGDVEAAQAGE